ncbi:putative Cyclic nucleotide-binding protein [uncultured Defluviicoccus sp.]|uniref:Putative Cyclic nucleotide-binding protein n=1 Tax=metagenome TaxID=256318 RepID=A0A380T7L9_9ZZZZ|nr:putative Cyclic nucleotide-binding protein [uncultured Defluviicoccus sp.]
MISRSENWIGQLSVEATRFVKQHGVMSTFKAGDEISPAGIESVAIYQLQSGYSKLTRTAHTGETSTLIVFGPGNSWGESPILANRLTRHACIALTECKVMEFPRASFLRLYREFAEVPDLLCLRFARSMSRRMLSYALPPSEKLGAMVARALCDCIAELPRDPGSNTCEIDFPLTQYDIASHLGVTRQSIHREVVSLKAMGVVDKIKDRWIVRDVHRLQRLAQGHALALDDAR